MGDLSQRLSLFQDYIGLTNNAFANKCGINPSNYAKMLKGQQTFTTRSLIKIGDAFPVLNTEWLITGEGEMLRADTNGKASYGYTDEQTFKSYFKETRQVMVPLINIDSVGGIHSQNLITSGEQFIEDQIPFPNPHPDDIAIYQSGDSMSPVIPPGAIMQLRRVDDWREYFGYGNVYVLWLKDDRRITKLVKRYTADPQNYIMCCSYNPDADDEELPKSMIREVWKVVNVLTRKGW